MCLLMQYKFSFLTASLNCGKAVSESEWTQPPTVEAQSPKHWAAKDPHPTK